MMSCDLCWHQALVQCGRDESQVPRFSILKMSTKEVLDVRNLFRKIDILVVAAMVFSLVLSSSQSEFWLLSFVRFPKIRRLNVVDAGSPVF